MQTGTCERCKRLNQPLNRATYRTVDGKLTDGDICQDCFDSSAGLPWRDRAKTEFQHGTGGGERVIRSGKEMS